jgi:hypothetical protein
MATRNGRLQEFGKTLGKGNVALSDNVPLFQTYFIPAWTEGPEKFSTYDFDGFVNWGAAWPSSTTDIDMADDKYTMSLLGARRLIATVSPIFFTHFSWKV